MQKIIPHLWFDHQAEEAVNFYTSIFQHSKILNRTHYGKEGADISGMPEGSLMTVTFQLEGQEFIALNGGPYFDFTPAISFFVNCGTMDEVNSLWQKISEGGIVLMELGQYPFSEKFGWVQDKYGVSWQVNLASHSQKITPFLMFVREQYGKAEEAMNLYISLFDHSGIVEMDRFGAGEKATEGKVMEFTLSGQKFMAMDSGMEHPFTFTEAISLFVNCETQDEVDILWDKLSQGGEKGRCGWLKDRFGVSWQIVPTALGEMLKDTDPKKVQNVMKAMLQMNKIDVETLKRAYEQR